MEALKQAGESPALCRGSTKQRQNGRCSDRYDNRAPKEDPIDASHSGFRVFRRTHNNRLPVEGSFTQPEHRYNDNLLGRGSQRTAVATQQLGASPAILSSSLTFDDAIATPRLSQQPILERLGGLDELPLVTQRFYRGRGHHVGGSGLGLAIVEVALAQFGGGKVALENSACGGLKATISLPAS